MAERDLPPGFPDALVKAVAVVGPGATARSVRDALSGAYGQSRRTIEQTLARLARAGRIERLAGGCYGPAEGVEKGLSS